MKAYIADAKLTVSYWCEYKPVGRKGEPGKAIFTVDIPVEDLVPMKACSCGWGESSISFTFKCPVCNRKHTFDLTDLNGSIMNDLTNLYGS